MSALTLPLSMEDYQKLFANDKEVSLKKFNIGYDFCKELKEKQLETSSIVTIVQKILRILLAVIILKGFVHLI